jgi:GcrA cell cycle regulator
MSWTDERIATLKKMWKEGKSAADIAKTLGKVTRNAVIGKAHRMGLSGRPSPIKKPPAAPKKEAAPKKTALLRSIKKPAPVAAVSKKANPLQRPEVEEPKIFEKETVPEGGGIPLIELTERMCKWPIGDPRDADFIFCGLGIRVGTPYCPGHAAMAYQTSSRGRPAAAAAKVKVVAAAEADEEELEDVAVEDGDDEDDDTEA